jgi:hypothetical protein
MTFYMLSEYEENLIKIHKRLHQAEKTSSWKIFWDTSCYYSSKITAKSQTIIISSKQDYV